MRVPPTPHTPSTPAMPALDSSEFKGGGDGDFWEFDTDRKAWKRVDVRPRKKLFAPVGRDCPIDVSDVSHERLTEWKCRGKISVHKDDWNKCPYQRISSKSWVGSTWFFPRDPMNHKPNCLQQPPIFLKVNKMPSREASNVFAHPCWQSLQTRQNWLKRFSKPQKMHQKQGHKGTNARFEISVGHVSSFVVPRIRALVR